MQMKHVSENEQDCNVTRRSLPCVATVSDGAVTLKIRLSRSRDPNTEGSVKDDGQENKSPFNHRQKRQTVDGENIVLKNGCSAQKTCIRH
jgi:hypothetical protein